MYFKSSFTCKQENVLTAYVNLEKKMFGWLCSNTGRSPPAKQHSRNTRDRKKMMADLCAQYVLTVQMI